MKQRTEGEQERGKRRRRGWKERRTKRREEGKKGALR